MNPTTANYDEPWKEALTEYFEAFLCFFFPEVNLENGFLGETRFLDFKIKKRCADKLYKERRLVWSMKPNARIVDATANPSYK